MPRVLWAYRTTKCFSIGETLFVKIYDTEAVIPTEIVDKPEINQNQLLLNLDLPEETRQIAQIRLASYQQEAHSFHAQKVKPCSFAVGDWVLHRFPTP